MALILYLSEERGAGARLRQIVGETVNPSELEVFSSLIELRRRLQQPVLGVGVVLLYAAVPADLRELLSLGELLDESRVLLVLPDDQQEALTMAHTLKPHVIAWAESDFSCLGVILKRMLSLYDAAY